MVGGGNEVDTPHVFILSFLSLLTEMKR